MNKGKRKGRDFDTPARWSGGRVTDPLPLLYSQIASAIRQPALVAAALAPWFLPVLVTGAATFAIGIFAFAKGIADSRILSRRLTWLVVGALVVMAIARLVPVGAVQFYVQGAAGIVALWPLAYEMWKRPEAVRPAGQPRPMPAA